GRRRILRVCGANRLRRSREDATGDRSDPGRMVRPQQAHGLGEEPLQATQSLRRNGPDSRHGPEASLAGVLSESSRNAPVSPRAESSSDRSNIGNTPLRRKKELGYRPLSQSDVVLSGLCPNVRPEIKAKGPQGLLIGF